MSRYVDSWPLPVASALFALWCLFLCFWTTGNQSSVKEDTAGLVDTGLVLELRSNERFQATVVSVHDGDTIIVDVAGWPAITGRRMGVRLFGVDAPELGDDRAAMAKMADQARLAVEQLCRPGDQVELSDVRRDKYFRLLCRVSFQEGGVPVDLGSRLLDRGLVRPYLGRGPKPW